MNLSNSEFQEKTVKKISRRIIPYLFLLYIFSYLDKVNIGYAALQMNAELNISSEVFGIASGIFFIGYFLFEVPSNIALNRFGARIWIARIMITWGIIGTLTAFVQDSIHLYVLRFLLGVCEAGFFPGIILYMTYWFRQKELAKMIALFMTAIAVAFIFGGPISGWVMDHVTVYNMAGWRWMFIVEGVPSIILGIITFFYLTDSPEKAAWLTSEEKEWIINELEIEKQKNATQVNVTMKSALVNAKVWILALIYILFITGGLGIGLWLPQIIKGLSALFTNTEVGLITTIPYIAAVVAMNWWSRRSDRKGERFFHSALPLIVFALGVFGMGAITDNPILSIFMIVITMAGQYCFNGPFWSLPPYFFSGSAAAVGIALINSVGNLGGFFGPYLMGTLKDMTGSVTIGLYVLCGCILLACILLIIMQQKYGKQEEKTHENFVSAKSSHQ